VEREGSGESIREAATTVARSQNTVYVLPPDAAAMRQFLAPVLERVDRAGEGAQLLVVATDAETAVEIARAAGQLPAGEQLRTVPVTGAARAGRLLRALAPQVVIGAPAELLELVRGATLKLDHVRTIVIAWADHLLELGQEGALEALMGELPKDAARTIVATRLTTGVEGLIERYARRAGRKGILPRDEDATARAELRVVTVGPGARPAALRRVLDELDPERAAVYVRSDEAEREVRAELRVLGAGDAVAVTRGEPVADAQALVLYELPDAPAALAALVAGGAAPVIALATPRQRDVVRALAGGGHAAPFTLAGPAARARAREEAVRAELRAALAEGAPSREMLALEPLLEEYDGVELAAAALRLLERAREKRAPGGGAAAAQPAAESAPASPWTRVFMTVGSMDGATARDFVGAIANEAGLTREQIGKVEVRDSHALVDVATDRAEHVVKSLRSVMIRGRPTNARLDRQPSDRRGGERSGERSGGFRSGGDRSGGDRSGGDRSAGERRAGGERRGGARGAPSRGAPSRGAPPRGGARGGERRPPRPRRED
jgi:ATP-dependent RNA helicase DeaD